MERNLIQDAERIQELTNDRIPFDRACWIALYIQRITSGMSHEQAIAAEEQEKSERGQASGCELCGEAFSQDHDCTRGDHHYTPRGWDHVDA